MNSFYKNKVCWISGASSGIGRATAIKLASLGAHVFISARSGDKLEQLAKEYPNLSLHCLTLDVLDYPALKSAQQTILDLFGRIDLLIANAGIYEPLDIEQLTAESVRSVLETNLIGASNLIFCCMQTFLSQGFGHIAGVASVVGYRALPKAAPYGASKAGLIYLLESLRFELQPKGISVSVINPGFVKTRLTDKNKFSMPFLISELKAADHIVAGLAKKKNEIAFPWQMALLAKLSRHVPNFIFNSLIIKSGDL